VIVQLIGADGQPAARTRTGSDGLFWFEKMQPGAYQVQLDPGQAERLGNRLNQAVSIKIDNQGSATHQDLLINPR
jgi:protocatechuate 3,4-dioxygenase beta subunit